LGNEAWRFAHLRMQSSANLQQTPLWSWERPGQMPAGPTASLRRAKPTSTLQPPLEIAGFDRLDKGVHRVGDPKVWRLSRHPVRLWPGHAISPNPGDRETRLPSSERPVSLLTPRWRKTDSNPRSLLGPEWICVETFRSAEGRKRSAEGLSLLPDRFHPSSFVDGRQSRSRECGREARLAALLRSRAPNGSKSDDPGPRCLRSGGLAHAVARPFTKSSPRCPPDIHAR
jgi:hypothetical protein